MGSRGGLRAAILGNKLLAALTCSLVAAEAMVSVATWYGVAVLGGREMNVVYGYSMAIEVGRPVLALLFAVLLVVVFSDRSQRLVGVSALLGLSIADLVYDSIYIATGAAVLAIGTGVFLACAVPAVCAFRTFDLSRAAA